MRRGLAAVIARSALVVALVAGAVNVVSVPAALAAGEVGRLQTLEWLPDGYWPPGADVAVGVTYTSTDAQGAVTSVTGRAFVPTGATPLGGWPVVSYAHGTTGLGDSCAPSTNSLNSVEKAAFSALLQQGYAVVVTDYAGLGGPGAHPYLDGAVEAYGTIDIMRAMRRLAPGLFAKRWAVAGYSQGGHAAMFTGNLARQYAPELDFRGTVAVAPPSNLAPLIGQFGPTTAILPKVVPLVSYVFAGVEVADPSFDMGSYLSPLGRSVVTDAATLCGAQMITRTKGVTIGQLLAKPLDADFERAFGAFSDVPTTGYDRPVLITQGQADVTVPQFLTDDLVAAMQAAGQPVTYKTYPSVDHNGAMAASQADMIAFLKPLLAGP